MSSSEVITVENLGKCYQIYTKPEDRLKQFLYPRFCQWTGITSKQYYREFWALKDVSFKVYQGEILGIIGRNGSGKSTLLQVLCGVLTPTTGSVSVRGKVAALLELGSGFNPEFTGRENVFLNASLYGLSQEETQGRMDDILAFADIGDFIDQPVKVYSSGMMVRLAFAVIAHIDADILVVDEALAVGDVFFVQKCMRFIKKFVEKNTLLFVTHDTSSIAALCSNAIILNSGSVLFSGSPKEAIKKYTRMQYENIQVVKQIGSFDNENRYHSQEKEKEKVLGNPTVTQEDCRNALLEKHSLLGTLTRVSKTLTSEFGDGAAQITAVDIQDETGESITSVLGHCRAKLIVTAKAKEYIVSPTIGFILTNRHGIHLISDNTFLSSLNEPVIELFPGQELQATFEFQMPSLRAGDYSLHVAIASGNQVNHKQHHYIHEAVVFKASPSFTVYGECNPPLIQCALKIIENHENI